MRTLPFSDPGTPDTRSPHGFLIWIARGQLGTLALGTSFGVVWMVAQALMPWAIGHGIDDIAAGETSSVWGWAALLGGLGVIQALSGVARHRVAVANWLYAAYRSIQVVTRHAARTGPALPRRLATGEVVATVSSDGAHIGHVFDMLPRFSGAVVSYVVVAVIVLRSSTALGLIVLFGVPLLVLSLVPLIRPLQQRQRAQREALGKLTSLGADTVAGLRVLRGIGGETVFAQRYGTRSELVRRAGIKLARTESLLDAVAVLLPGLFLALLTWAGARLVLAGTVEPGALVALYGYAFFLVIPVRTAAEMAFILTRALVAARRMLAVLAIQPDVNDVGTVAGSTAEPEAGSVVLVDPTSGLRVPAGRLTMLVADDPSTSAAIADRLGRLVPDSEVRLDGVHVAELPLADVRRRIVVSDPEPTLFTGTLRSGLDPHGHHDDADLIAAMEAAAAGDVLDTLRDGLDSIVEERGRSLSGGQRQRVGLARVLVTDPEVLVLVEPTSAVDAHTEAAIARTLRQARSGRTTVVVTASPLMLAQADSVVWLDDGQVSAIGSHEELLATVSAYRYTVTREEDAA